MAGFKDHFSGHAAEYAVHRPRYPAALFDWLATEAREDPLPRLREELAPLWGDGARRVTWPLPLLAGRR